MGVPKMPASHAEHRIARDPVRGPLAADLFRGCNGDARRYCLPRSRPGQPGCNSCIRLQRIIAEEQAFGATRVYPAAWPQAKKHPLVQLVFKGYGNHQARCM